MALRPNRYRDAIVPHIYVARASDAIAFYKRAFGAEELFRIAGPDGKILHAEISICNSVLMIGDPDDKLYGEPRKLGGCTASLHVFTDDNAALLQRAVEAGAEQIQPPREMFYGAKSASLRDPFGHVWVLLTWMEDLPPDEMERRGYTFLAHERRAARAGAADGSDRVAWLAHFLSLSVGSERSCDIGGPQAAGHRRSIDR
jgi:PhnB protein